MTALPLPAVVFTDVDDTLTWEGRLPAVALAALERLASAGVSVVPVTGACAGWCDQMARTWPVAAVIGENGAFVVAREGRHLRYQDTQDAATRERHRVRLEAVAAGLVAADPRLGLAQDNGYRRYDVAVDHAQEVAPVPADAVRRALEEARAAGVQATASSIHINLWLGDFSKRIAALRWLAARPALSDDTARHDGRVVFVGDSPNDAEMFEAFPCSVGVANVRPHLAALPRPPAWVTQAPGGFGFAEWVARVCDGGL